MGTREREREKDRAIERERMTDRQTDWLTVLCPLAAVRRPVDREAFKEAKSGPANIICLCAQDEPILQTVVHVCVFVEWKRGFGACSSIDAIRMMSLVWHSFTEAPGLQHKLSFSVHLVCDTINAMLKSHFFVLFLKWIKAHNQINCQQPSLFIFSLIYKGIQILQ